MKELTSEMIRKLLEYNGGRLYKALLRRFRAAAKNGGTQLPCPLCTAASSKRDEVYERVGGPPCSFCPVFSGYECKDYLPAEPLGVACYAECIEVDHDPAAHAVGKEWAAQIVALLEGLAPEGDSTP